MTAVGPSLVKSSSVCLGCKRVCAEDGGSFGRREELKVTTPHAPARAHLPLLPSGPGGVQRDNTT